MSAIHENSVLSLMATSRAQLDAAASRAGKLATIVERLGAAHSGPDITNKTPGGGDGDGGRSSVDAEDLRRTLGMIDEVSAELLAAAEEGEDRSSLESYCDDVHAHGLAMLGQVQMGLTRSMGTPDPYTMSRDRISRSPFHEP